MQLLKTRQVCVPHFSAANSCLLQSPYQVPQSTCSTLRALILFMCRMTSLVLHGLLTHAWKECTHQLALPWGTRHLISPELAEAFVTGLLLIARRP